MTPEKFDLVCNTFIDVVLMPNLRKDEPDARYDIIYRFNPTSLKVDFWGIKIRPQYMIERMYQFLGSYESYKLEELYDDYMEIKAKLTFNLWERSLIREE